MAEGIVSASNPAPPADAGEQARFDAALTRLLDDQFPRDESHQAVDYPPGFAPDDAPEPEPTPAPEPTPEPEPSESEPAREPEAEPAPVAQEPGGGPTNFAPPTEVEAQPDQEPEAQPQAQAQEPTTDLNRIFEAYLGRVPSSEDTIALLNFVTELQSLPVEHQAVVERALRRDPSLLAPQPQQSPQQSPPAPQPKAKQRAREWDDEDDEPTPDPRVMELESRLAVLEQQRQQSEHARYQQWVNYERETTKSAAVGDAQSQGLDQNDLAILEAKVHQLGNYSALLRSHNNDPGTAYAAALDIAYWATPTFRDQAIRRAASNQAAQAVEDADRKTLASAVSASNASAARPIAKDRPTTLAEAKRAAAAELAAVFDV